MIGWEILSKFFKQSKVSIYDLARSIVIPIASMHELYEININL